MIFKAIDFLFIVLFYVEMKKICSNLYMNSFFSPYLISTARNRFFSWLIITGVALKYTHNIILIWYRIELIRSTFSGGMFSKFVSAHCTMMMNSRLLIRTDMLFFYSKLLLFNCELGCKRWFFIVLDKNSLHVKKEKKRINRILINQIAIKF